MGRRKLSPLLHLFLVAVRLGFALSPSYLHPDENFQGPEVIAGEIFSYPVTRTWEFTSSAPIRSVFPLWPVYGFPMLLLRWLWMGSGDEAGPVPPIAVFWTLRVLMFALSFVLEDWAILELMQLPRHRKTAALLVASSYVTCTYQTHTFSNSLETLIVAWSMVLLQRVSEGLQGGRSAGVASAIFGMVAVFGVFNRITFPAFLLVPGLYLLPRLVRHPLTLVIMAVAALGTTIVAIALDTAFYTPHLTSWADVLSHPVITPLNNLRYNIQTDNLAQHGLHPWWTHIAVNVPLLIGPAVILVATSPVMSVRLYSAVTAIGVLSIFQHQEARFLQPAVPLILSSIQLPRGKRMARLWISVWILYNLVFGILMGRYHQGGVVPAQVFMAQQPDATHALWWKTYSPPTWLLNGKNEVLRTHDLIGVNSQDMMTQLAELATCDTPADRRNNEYLKENNGTYLVAPASTVWLDKYLTNKGLEGLRFREVWRHRQHLNLDDLDIAEDGFWPTVQRVVGRRGLVIWRVTKTCR